MQNGCRIVQKWQQLKLQNDQRRRSIMQFAIAHLTFNSLVPRFTLFGESPVDSDRAKSETEILFLESLDFAWQTFHSKLVTGNSQTTLHNEINSERIFWMRWRCSVDAPVDTTTQLIRVRDCRCLTEATFMWLVLTRRRDIRRVILLRRSVGTHRNVDNRQWQRRQNRFFGFFVSAICHFCLFHWLWASSSSGMIKLYLLDFIAFKHTHTHTLGRFRFWKWKMWMYDWLVAGRRGKILLDFP